MSDSNPKSKVFQNDGTDFVSVVSVGSEDSFQTRDNSERRDCKKENNGGYVTVLKIGDTNQPKEIIEEVLVYRLPGERLGFGLKFEGGTKAAEFVKRLFIQSCAPDSPASMVHCSWGKLSEGDEVLKIDHLPVTSMTRIDCVRCLKDSNVVIKLLVRHFTDSSARYNNFNHSATEDAPLVISAEKKQTPAQPPPVPPRKISRKMLKELNSCVNNNFSKETEHNEVVLNANRNGRFQSPRSSGRLTRQSPDVSRRRGFSDNNSGPPEAELYLDLLSQESGCNLSESDDTGSSISTIIDRSSSFPTTTNSSFAGSLPSTPTSIQKQLDVCNILNPFDNDETDAIPCDKYLFAKLALSQHCSEIADVCKLKNDDDEKCNNKENEESSPLQPPNNFQDAPLSYGDEDVGVVEASLKLSLKRMKYCTGIEKGDENGNCWKSFNLEMKKKEGFVENINEEVLPRLVNFVPKSENESKLIQDSVKIFLENEVNFYHVLGIGDGQSGGIKDYEDGLTDAARNDFYNSGLFNLSWSLSSQLATIGEDDEEACQDILLQKASAPIVIIENADTDKNGTTRVPIIKQTDVPDGSSNHTSVVDEEVEEDLEAENNSSTYDYDSSNDSFKAMESPPSSSRQPPDGDEFPDFHEATPAIKIENVAKDSSLLWKNTSRLWKTDSILYKDQQSSCSVRDKIAIFSNITSSSNALITTRKNYKSSDDILLAVETEENKKSNQCKSHESTLTKAPDNSTINSLRASYLEEEFKDVSLEKPRLHTRSQSLMDISSTGNYYKKDRWSLLVEQRQRTLSKLKGLIIPERIAEVDSVAVVDLPEIRSNDVPSIVNNEPVLPLPQTETIKLNASQPQILCATLPLSWTCDNPTSVPKYSPAFKRKSLQIHSTFSSPKIENDSHKPTTQEFELDSKLMGNLYLSDPPKSLESITSPTQSDLSFEYLNNTMDNRTVSQESLLKSSHYDSKTKENDKFENESDNDSAVSSCQSSYIFRVSPQMSPTNSSESEAYRSHLDIQVDNQNHRFLKAQSVEAINRKNILASAKCRSGKDRKIGSPLIQRRTEKEKEESNCLKNHEELKQEDLEKVISSKLEPKKTQQKVTSPFQNVNNSVVTKQKLTVENHIPKSLLVKNADKDLLSNNVKGLRKSFEQLVQVPNDLDKKIVTKQTSHFNPTKVRPAKSSNTSRKISQPTSLEIILKPEIPGGSVGITLAGGADYESKEVLVHKIRANSSAYRDGRLEKGDEILSINNKSVVGLTHRELVSLLKEPLPQVTLVISKAKQSSLESSKTTTEPLAVIIKNDVPIASTKTKTTVTLIKEVTGLGLSLEGGQDSPIGNVPLLIKKIFKGGPAEKCGKLEVGDELASVNGIDVSFMSRFEAWNVLKKLPEGIPISLTVKR